MGCCGVRAWEGGVSELDIWTALRERFPSPEYAYLEEVRNSTGFARTVRTADALVMGLWPSRGLELHGIEVKVSRSDWLREKKTPEKAEEIARYCDRWWLAVRDPEIIKEGELPPTWGLLAPKGKKLVAKVEAPKLTPVPLDRVFLAAILRQAAESNVPRAEFDKAVFERVESANKQHQEAEERVTKRLQEEIAQLQQSIRAFETASGVTISRWTGSQRIGEAVRLVLDGGLKAKQRQLEHLADEAERLAQGIRAGLAPNHFEVIQEPDVPEGGFNHGEASTNRG